MARRASGKRCRMKNNRIEADQILDRSSRMGTDLPYEKFTRIGPELMSEAELLAIVIRTGTREASPLQIGNRVLELPAVLKEGLGGLYHVSIKELMEIKGIGEVKAVKIKCLAELSRRIAASRAQKSLQFTQPSSVADYYMESLRHLSQEKVMLLLLDNRANLVGESVLSIGTVNTSLLSPREVFIKALKAEAVMVMLLHNHPSGDPTPSKQDLIMTDKIRKLGALIDIPLMDHIIIGDNQYMSFKEAGLL